MSGQPFLYYKYFYVNLKNCDKETQGRGIYVDSARGIYIDPAFTRRIETSGRVGGSVGGLEGGWLEKVESMLTSALD